MSTHHDTCPLVLQEQEINAESNCTRSYNKSTILLNSGEELQDQQTTAGNPVLAFQIKASQHQQEQQERHQTTSACQTFVHLLKGYMGAGCLSLPWAISQLGFQWGSVAIIAISLWSSYNCWTIVKLKRFVMEQQRQQHDQDDNEEQVEDLYSTHGTSTYDSTSTDVTMGVDDDKGSSHSIATATSITTNTTNTKITYPAVGEFFYGSIFETYVAACVCTQQLAICTVFISFVGENILAVLQRQQQQQQQWNVVPSFLATHAGAMAMELPFLIGLSLIPNLKRLSPIMVTGTILLMVTFVAIGVIMVQVWPKDQDQHSHFYHHDWHRAHDDDTKNEDHDSVFAFQHLASVPLAVSAILYSYEGINLILPVESAMGNPQQFQIPFVLAMMCVALVLVMFSILCVVAFGNVTNGSITAFLIQEYPNDPNISWWIMVANISVSLSVLLTYPIQLFPALELLAPPFSRFWQPQEVGNSQDHDLSGFEPLPPLPEHDIPNYDDDRREDEEEGGLYYYTSTPEPPNPTTIDRKQEETMSVTFSTTITSIYSVIIPESTTTGESPMLRILLVLLTFFIAGIVPNVQSLISLAGALAGSSSALLIPPLLELAWIQHNESIRTNCPLTGQQDHQSPPENIITERSPLRCAVGGQSKFSHAWLAKSKCYILLLGGVLFFVVGTLASLADIVQIYWTEHGR